MTDYRAWIPKSIVNLLALQPEGTEVNQDKSKGRAEEWQNSLLTSDAIYEILRNANNGDFLQQGETTMKYKFTANFNIEGKPISHKMEYDSVDIVKTLERRLKTAFPNATGIAITLDEAVAFGGVAALTVDKDKEKTK